MAAVAAALVALQPNPWLVLAGTLALGLPLGSWLLWRVLRPVAKTLEALRDGVRGLHDRDFSLQIAGGRRDELGELVALYNTVADTLREQRGALVQKEILFDTILQATPIGLVLTNQRRRVVFANRAARELLVIEGAFEGADFGAILGGCPEVMREALAAGRDAVFSHSAEGEEEVFHVARRTFQVNAQRHDLYLLQRLTQELRRQEVAVWKKAIRTMQHELGNSLAPITSLARSMRHILAGSEHAARLAAVLDVIEERSAHLLAFLEGYARFARLPGPERREVGWREFLAELADLYPFRLAGELPAAPGRFDPQQMQQALINLLKNAAESGSPPEEITLAVERTADGGFRLRVADRGAGMSDEGLRRALLPFYTSKSGGSGLGLPLAREIVEAHGGRLRIERREGGGTAVVCWLPGG
jgi:nitrogen fixation/metabolism regulation signal transduction histidine kinase